METLKPFSPLSLPLAVKAEILPVAGGLSFRFELDDPDQLVLDSLEPGSYFADQVAREHLLWKTTCFEAFWGHPGEKSYWELNVAGSGKKWNCYHFTDFRAPFPPESCHDFEMDRVEVTKNSLHCVLRGNVKNIEASLCVILRTSGGTYYFSQTHEDKQPNFHLRKSFSLKR